MAFAKPKITGEKYYIHDNGGRPFLINIGRDNVISVYKITYTGEGNYRFREGNYFRRVMRLSTYKKLFIGKDDRYPHCDGHVILINTTDNKYIFIGSEIEEFVAREPINQFLTYVGNNDVPYSWAISDNYTYLIQEHVFLNNTDIPESKRLVDAYKYYYFDDNDMFRLKEKIPSRQYRSRIITRRILF